MRHLLVMLSLTLTALSLRADDKPNIIMILADDMGYADCGFMGGTEIKTPNLDKLASQGAILDAFYVQPVCSPTRASFMTGRYPMRMGLQEGVIRPYAKYGLPLEEQTLAQGLHAAGYATTIVGKWHLGEVKPDYLPTHRGFDHHYGHYLGAIDYFTHMRDGGLDWHRDGKASYDKGYSTHLIGDDAARTVTEYAGKKPFFLYVPFNAVHSPLQVPEEYTAPYANLKKPRQTYAGMLTAMDENVGKIVAAVDKAGDPRQHLVHLFQRQWWSRPRPGDRQRHPACREGNRLRRWHPRRRVHDLERASSSPAPTSPSRCTWSIFTRRC